MWLHLAGNCSQLTQLTFLSGGLSFSRRLEQTSPEQKLLVSEAETQNNSAFFCHVLHHISWSERRPRLLVGGAAKNVWPEG